MPRAIQNPRKELSYPSCLLKHRNTLGPDPRYQLVSMGDPKKKGHGTLNLPWRKLYLGFYCTFKNVLKGKKFLRLVKKILDFYLILSLISRGKVAAYKRTHAQILLKADESPAGPNWPDKAISEAFTTTVSTVERVRKAFVFETTYLS